jgi:hypothetical protein
MSLSDVVVSNRNAEEAFDDRMVEANEGEIKSQRGLGAHVSQYRIGRWSYSEYHLNCTGVAHTFCVGPSSAS